MRPPRRAWLCARHNKARACAHAETQNETEVAHALARIRCMAVMDCGSNRRVRAHSMPPSSTSTKRKSDAMRGTLARTSDSLPSTSNDRRSAEDVVGSPASAMSTGSGAQRTRCVPLPTLAAAPESEVLTLTYPATGHTAACSMAARRRLRFSRSKLLGFASISKPVPGTRARAAHTTQRTCADLGVCVCI